jgi:2-polyprenyl-3-methyl-5-hydroxy-6-metoxy-1,4-benzoquinol methylase
MNVYDRQTLLEIFDSKYRASHELGWGPKQRLQFGYFTPDDIYETVVASLVNRETSWLDVGCGRDVFPSNVATAKLLADRCRVLVGVDPSDNIHRNTLVHERFCGLISQFRPDFPFDLVTLRMVAEHVTDPEATSAAFHRICKPGGRVVVYTVYKWSPVTVISSIVPFKWHNRLKNIIWKTQEEDTFPTAYRMNTRSRLSRIFTGAGFEEEHFYYLDDCRTLARWRFTNALELSVWKMLRTLEIHYPEVCLLGIYRRLG